LQNQILGCHQEVGGERHVRVTLIRKIFVIFYLAKNVPSLQINQIQQPAEKHTANQMK